MSIPLAHKVAEAAGIIGISERYLRELIEQGQIPVVELGERRVVIRHESLEAFLKTRETYRGPAHS